MPSELGNLVARHGGEAVSAPALREAALPTAAGCSGTLSMASAPAPFKAAVFLTGVGARALINAADQLGRKNEVSGRPMRNNRHLPRPKACCRPQAAQRADSARLTIALHL